MNGSRLLLLLATFAGLSLGWGGAMVFERAQLDAGPSGWSARHPPVPVLLASLAGPPNLPGDGFPLDSHGQLTAPMQSPASVSVEATVPSGGQVELVLGGGGRRDGVALWISRVGEPFAGVFEAGAPVDQTTQPMAPREALRCSPSLTPPSTAAVSASLAVDASGIVATVGDAQTRCARRRVGGEASIRSGLRRVGLHQISVGGGQGTLQVEAPGPRWGVRLIAAIGGGGLALGWAVLALSRGSLGLVLPLLPLLAVGPLAGGDMARLLQSARVLSDWPEGWALGLPLAVTAWGVALWSARWVVRQEGAGPWWWGAVALGALGLGGIVVMGAFGLLAGAVLALVGVGAGLAIGRRWPGLGLSRGLVAVGGLGLLALGMAAAMDPAEGMAVIYAAEIGALVGVIVWVNARELRGFNLISLAGVVLAAVAADQGLRWTAYGGRLMGVSGRGGAGMDDPGSQQVDAFSGFRALEETQAFRDYPDQDYPVRPTPRRADATRLVALGGSSTGGAWQNDDLDEFWPAEVERSLGGTVQAVNQGVGGWTSLHIRRYLETRMDLVDPDVVVLYIGHNDILTESPRPYRQLHAAWRAGGGWSMGVSKLLAGVPAYQAARFWVQALVRSGGGAAVPVDDARGNIAAIHDLLSEREVPMVLALEGVAPDPSVLGAYGGMMDALAAAPDIAYVDTASRLADPRQGTTFLDDCHLTATGHAVVARAIVETLQTEGWVE